MASGDESVYRDGATELILPAKCNERRVTGSGRSSEPSARDFRMARNREPACDGITQVQ